jgi:hypothetical protein
MPPKQSTVRWHAAGVVVMQQQLAALLHSALAAHS